MTSPRRFPPSWQVEQTPGGFEVLEPSGLSRGQRKALEAIRGRVLERWGGTGVQGTLNAAFFQLLDSILVYPVEDAEKLTDHDGRILPDCYLVSRGTTARRLASLIHTELEESFIYAVDARTKRRLGDGHVLQNNDVIQIVAAKARR